MGWQVVAIVVILAGISIPISYIIGPAITSLVPLAMIAMAIWGFKHLMEVHHRQKLELLEKQKEIQMLEYEHLKQADKIIND